MKYWCKYILLVYNKHYSGCAIRSCPVRNLSAAIVPSYIPLKKIHIFMSGTYKKQYCYFSSISYIRIGSVYYYYYWICKFEKLPKSKKMAAFCWFFILKRLTRFKTIRLYSLIVSVEITFWQTSTESSSVYVFS